MEKNYESLRLKNQLCFPLYAASREIVKKYTPFLEALGLTYTQYVTMMVVWEERELSAKTLGEKLFLDSGTLTPVLKALEKKGYVARARSKEDERVLMVSLTEEGGRLREEALKVPEQMRNCIRLTPEEAGELYRLLYKILGRGEEAQHRRERKRVNPSAKRAKDPELR